ncbi:hypothetical protein E1293_23670 [Actinomadura darangshiensis]|uniref:Uncharacterized protein n=1 Tax=Actinomadura darangshiensis TaxID=705336 RepID=A0A4R5B474_9ACTN|nr:hypothetical protein [Actinomadura darangshiensis]TDD79340.1 hypothetical protein E1293_23670 [Actinomadura darangshiensis]
MNNAARGVILSLGLLGMAVMFFGIMDYVTTEDFKASDLAGTIGCGFVMLSCAVIAAAALAGMKPEPPKPTASPYQQQQGLVPPQAEPYPHHGAVPPQYPPQH